MTSSVHTSSVHDDVRTLNASDSDSLPSSLANSLQNLTTSKHSVGSGSKHGSKHGSAAGSGSGAGSQQLPQSPDPEQFIAELLEKAKFYTSLCLGECKTTMNMNIFR